MVAFALLRGQTIGSKLIIIQVQLQDQDQDQHPRPRTMEGLTMASPFATFSEAIRPSGRKLWELATKPLKTEYDGGKPGYNIFKSQTRNKIRTCLWRDITSFVVNNQVFTLVDNADLIPLRQVNAARRERENIIITGVRNMEQPEGPNNRGS